MNSGFLDANVGATYTSSSRKQIAVELQQLRDVPCLILLGEPGLGKSHEAYATQQSSRKVLPPDDQLLDFRLGDFQDSHDLRQEVFNNEVLRRWRTGSGTLHLWLDALDEGHYHIKTIAASLGTSIKALPVDRLRLRILCRSADWPLFLEDELKVAWKTEEKRDSPQSLTTSENNEDGGDSKNEETSPVQAWELAPLRFSDARSWATQRGVDAATFLDAVSSRKITALAAKPLTLEFLIGQYANSSTLPDSRAELYELGCREMCKESNRARQTSGAVGVLDPDERLAISTRVAGVMLLSNRGAIDMHFDSDKAITADITTAKMLGGFENVRSASCVIQKGAPPEPRRVEVTKENIEETLRYTALFSSRGPSRLGWRHQTYAEYLAARFLHLRHIGARRAMDVLCFEGRIVPQLREVASWLASLEPSFFDELLDNDPEVALHSDILWAGDNFHDQAARRERLADALLKALKDKKVISFDLWRACGRLSHPRLATQVLTLLTQHEVSDNERTGALAMCESCDWFDVSSAVLELALNQNQSETVRCYAVIAVANHGDEASLKSLLPLARGELGAGGNLRGLALGSVWPHYLSAPDLFRTLVAPQEEGGSQYEHFIASDIVRHLQVGELPLALDWVCQQEQESSGRRYGINNFYIERMSDMLVLRAWAYLQSPGVTESLASLIAERVAHHRPMFGSNVESIEGS